MHLRSLLHAALSVVALAGPCSAVAADALGEVARLHRAGDDTAALKGADAYLSAHPKDAQMRFLKAVILGDAMRSAEAAVVLEKLTEDYPDLAEPYNNLAALYASTGDYPKARAALEQALRLKPGYAVAHANLGDLYAALAAQSYAAALRLDPTLDGIAAKLAQVRQVAAPRSASPAASAAAPASAPR